MEDIFWFCHPQWHLFHFTWGTDVSGRWAPPSAPPLADSSNPSGPQGSGGRKTPPVLWPAVSGPLEEAGHSQRSELSELLKKPPPETCPSFRVAFPGGSKAEVTTLSSELVQRALGTDRLSSWVSPFPAPPGKNGKRRALDRRARADAQAQGKAPSGLHECVASVTCVLRGQGSVKSSWPPVEPGRDEPSSTTRYWR